MKKIFAFLILLSIISCKKYKLSKFEKELYEIYNVGDTLTFESIKTGNIIRYVITDKTNEIYSNFDTRERLVTVNYRNVDKPLNTDPNNTYKPEIFSIYNNKYGYSIHIAFNLFGRFYENNFGTIKTDTLSYLNKKYSDYYTLTNTSNINEGLETKLLTIYWQKKYGIVKYDLLNGDSYVRTNIP